MKTEINAAVNFLVENMRNVLNQTLRNDQIENFQNVLSASLAEKFDNHWYEDKPLRGSAYRCIQIIPEEHYVHPLLKDAMQKVGISFTNIVKVFGKGGIWMWIDPSDVSCRLGTGAIFPVYRKISQSKQPSVSTEGRQQRPQQRPGSISPPQENHGNNSVLSLRSSTPPGFSNVHSGQMYHNVATGSISPDTTFTLWGSRSDQVPILQSHYSAYSSGQPLEDTSFSFNQYSSYYKPKPTWKRNYRAKQKPQWQDQELYQRYHWSKPASSDDIPVNVNEMLSMQHLQEVY